MKKEKLDIPSFANDEYKIYQDKKWFKEMKTKAYINLFLLAILVVFVGYIEAL